MVRTPKGLLYIYQSKCIGCGKCEEVCRHNVLQLHTDDDEKYIRVKNSKTCVACGKCVVVCPTKAIEIMNDNNITMKRKMNKKKNVLRGILHGLCFVAIVAAAVAVVMLLWNAIIPQVIGWSVINYWQAAGLLALSKLLFGGFGHRHHGHFWHGGRGGRKDMRDRMKGMSRDERRDFIRKRMSANFDAHFNEQRPSVTNPED